MFREKDRTEVKLGVETVIAVNDGGLAIEYNLGDGYRQWQHGGLKGPILSLEVSSLTA